MQVRRASQPIRPSEAVRADWSISKDRSMQAATACTHMSTVVRQRMGPSHSNQQQPRVQDAHACVASSQTAVRALHKQTATSSSTQCYGSRVHVRHDAAGQVWFLTPSPAPAGLSLHQAGQSHAQECCHPSRAGGVTPLHLTLAVFWSAYYA